MIIENAVKNISFILNQIKAATCKNCARIHWEGFFVVEIKYLVSKKDDDINLNIAFF